MVKHQLQNIIVTFNVDEEPFKTTSQDGFVDLMCEVFEHGSPEVDTINSILSIPVDLYLDVLNARNGRDGLYFSFQIQDNFRVLKKKLSSPDNGIVIDDGDGGVLIAMSDNEDGYEIIKEF